MAAYAGQWSQSPSCSGAQESIWPDERTYQTYSSRDDETTSGFEQGDQDEEYVAASTRV